MSFWTLAHVARVILGDPSARWLIEPRADAALEPLAGLNTDTRKTQPGEVFFAIKGEKFDANDLIDQAAQRGASLIVIDRESAVQKLAAIANKPAVLLVADVVVALQKLAAAYRDHLRTCGVKVIVIAGSNGKTTTRHLIHSVLSAPGGLKGTQSLKSNNNHLGVPMTLLGAKETDQFVCVEAGTNHPGELGALGQIARPDAVVITSIGHEHMEFFKTLAGVAEEEASILAHLAPAGLAVLPGDGEAWSLLEPYARAMLGRAPATQLLRFGESADNDLRLRGCTLDAGGSRFQVEFSTRLRDANPLSVRLSLLGEHNSRNALAAIAVARWMGLNFDVILAALGKATPVEMRLVVSRIPENVEGVDAARQITLINDAYNANPDSVAAGLRTLCEFPTPGQSRRIAILGDMRELGDEGPDLHRKIGRLIAELGTAKIAFVVLIGRLSFFTADALSRSWPKDKLLVFPDWDDSLPEKVAAVVQAGDVVLIKASRGVGLERLVPQLKLRAAELATPHAAR